ncbi:MAG: hypothetical protein CMD19_02545 [Flavobacteriales bacterium]|nr:hypothetical protein [Flavobacteriales bacterium]|tara:strand:+ start:48707 stop:49918 length:1212 start_codon:yes stop_codon:yes gene_type:complete
MLVLSTGGLLFVFNRNSAFLLFASIIIFSLFYIGKGIKRSIYYSSFITFIVVLALFAINFVFAINPQSLTKYSFFGVIIFTTILTLFYFNNQGNKDYFINSLYFVLKLILFQSLFSFIAYFFVKDNLFLLTSEYHDTETFNYLFYYSVKEGSVINLLGLDIHRNSGIFWEPGILQVYLNILFFLEVSIFNRNKKLLGLIILGILSTYSTTGLLLLIIQLIYFSQTELKRYIPIILIALISIPLYFISSVNLNEKIYGEREFSFQKRLFDLTQPFFIALEHPITGVGLDIVQFQNVREEFYINSNLDNMLAGVGIQQKLETTSKGSTNSIMYMLAGMGFPTSILFIFMFIKQQIIIKHRFLWFTLSFFSVMSEPLLFKPFFFIFIISGFSHFFYKVVHNKKQLA